MGLPTDLLRIFTRNNVSEDTLGDGRGRIAYILNKEEVFTYVGSLGGVGLP